MAMEATPLLTPYTMGEFNLAHRVVHAPMTRCRSYGNMAQPHNVLYYAQRAAPGVVLIAEASAVSATAPGYPPVPGLWSQEQVEAWKPVVDAVHAKGALFFCQIWHMGNVSPTELAAPPAPGLEAQEIPQIVSDFRVAARNAIEAGFDGVEIHATNGLLVNKFIFFLDAERANSQPLRRRDQFIEDDAANMENLCRFATEVITAVADEVGAHRLGVRLSRVADYDSDPEALPLHVIRLMNDVGALYCHMVEPRNGIPRSLLPFRKAFKGTFIVNGGYNWEEGDKAVGDGYSDLVSYGRLFLANPDLPEWFRKNEGLNKYDRGTFYTSDPVVGYTDYPFLAQGQGTQVAT